MSGVDSWGIIRTLTTSRSLLRTSIWGPFFVLCFSQDESDNKERDRATTKMCPDVTGSPGTTGKTHRISRGRRVSGGRSRCTSRFESGVGVCDQGAHPGKEFYKNNTLGVIGRDPFLLEPGSV